MKKLVASYAAFILLSAGLATVTSAAPAAANSSPCTVTGNTWTEFRGSQHWAVGSGNVNCGVSHSTMFIRVTLQEEYPEGFWRTLSSASKGPISNVSSIYKQTSEPCVYTAQDPWRVKIEYTVTGNSHSGTVYRGQDTLDCWTT